MSRKRVQKQGNKWLNNFEGDIMNNPDVYILSCPLFSGSWNSSAGSSHQKLKSAYQEHSKGNKQIQSFKGNDFGIENLYKEKNRISWNSSNSFRNQAPNRSVTLLKGTSARVIDPIGNEQFENEMLKITTEEDELFRKNNFLK